MSFGFGFGFPKNYVAALFNTPASLFTTGVNGAWYDPSDFSTMFQDAAGTTPVTAVGQPVGRILDKSGRGGHAYNPSGNSANYPVLQQDGTGQYYLSFNGVNQWLRSIGSIDLTYGDKVFVSAGVRKLSDAATGLLAEMSNAFDTTNGAFSFAIPASSTYKYAFTNKGTIAVSAATVSASFTAPITNILSGVSSISTPLLTLRVNGSQAAQDITSQGTGNYGNYPLYIGARAGTSLFFNGRLYGLVVAGKQASASEIASTETWLNQKTGAY